MIVVIVVVAVVLAMVIPQVLNAIRRANENRTRSHMKMLALALQNHLDKHKTFPPLFFSADRERQLILNPAEAMSCYPWQVSILPFLEEEALHRKIAVASDDFTKDAALVKIPADQGQFVSPRTISLSLFQSPHLAIGPPGVCHYVALSSTRLPLLTNIGVDKAGQPAFQIPKPDGLLIPDINAAGQPASRIADGTSRTIVLCETREQERSNWFNPPQAFVCGFLPEDTIPINAAKTEYYPYFNPMLWIFNPVTGDRTALNMGPGSDSARYAYNTVNPADPLARAWGPSTGNSELITVHGMADGSVQEVVNDVEPKAYFAAITLRGGEHLGPISAE